MRRQTAVFNKRDEVNSVNASSIGPSKKPWRTPSGSVDRHHVACKQTDRVVHYETPSEGNPVMHTPPHKYKFLLYLLQHGFTATVRNKPNGIVASFLCPSRHMGKSACNDLNLSTAGIGREMGRAVKICCPTLSEIQDDGGHQTGSVNNF